MRWGAGSAERGRVVIGAPLPATVAAVQGYLEEYGSEVLVSGEPAEVVVQVGSRAPHLVVLSMPSLLDLLDLCRHVRAISAVPLGVLGQRPGEEDEVLCLEYGADAYLGPGASPRRIRAQLGALLRRGIHELHEQQQATPRFGDVRIDVQQHRVYRGDRELELSQKEYALLIYLVEHAGRAISRQDLADFVWGPNVSGESRSLDVHIHWLREKVEVDAANPQHIRTVRGVGYRFEA